MPRWKLGGTLGLSGVFRGLLRSKPVSRWGTLGAIGGFWGFADLFAFCCQKIPFCALICRSTATGRTPQQHQQSVIAIRAATD